MNGLTELEQRANDEARHAHRELVEEADAREAAAYEAAAIFVEEHTADTDPAVLSKSIADFEDKDGRSDHLRRYRADRIRALTPADAKAALDRLIAEAVQADRERQRKWETGDE